MRIRLALFTLALGLIFAMAFAGSARVAPVNAQGATCDDATYLTEVGKDFEALGKDLTSVDSTKVDSIIGAELSISVLRQKYEDMSNVPANCFTTNLLVITYAANLNDLLTLQTGLLSDKANADTYNKALANQKDRVSKFQQLLTQSFAGAAKTPAASS